METVRADTKAAVLRHWSLCCALVALIVGGLFLCAWLLQIGPVINPGLGLAATKANAALGITLAGLALLLMLKQSPRRSQLAGIFVTCIGLLTLYEWHSHLSLGIDQLLCKDISEQVASLNTPRMGYQVPGRMGPNTAQCLVLIGLALVTLQYAGTRTVGYVLSITTLLISLLSVIGNLYRVPRILGIQSFIEMAPLTSALLFIVSFGTLCAYPRYGVMALMASDTTGGLAARRFLPACVITPIVVGWLALKGQALGWYPPPFTVALLIVCMVIFLTLLIWWLSHSMDQKRRASRPWKAK